MRWIKTSEQKPEIGTYCLCKEKYDNGDAYFDVAQYTMGCWCVYGDDVRSLYSIDHYDCWFPISEIDEELSHEVD